MTEINKLLDRYQQFYDEYFVHSPELYRKLSAEGQAPKTLVIACSDSRVDPSIIFKSEPGELFVIRNVASLVPPFECDFVHCHGTSAAIEYAVRHLGVENIVVLGHSHCGGIKTLVDDHGHEHNFIDSWLSIADEAARERKTMRTFTVTAKRKRWQSQSATCKLFLSLPRRLLPENSGSAAGISALRAGGWKKFAVQNDARALEKGFFLLYCHRH